MEAESRKRVSNSLPGRPVPALEKFIPNPKLKLLDQCREVLRFYHYSIRTEEAYTSWIIRFILFHQKRHPRELPRPGLERTPHRR